jgi:hypothetical protein
VLINLESSGGAFLLTALCLIYRVITFTFTWAALSVAGLSSSMTRCSGGSWCKAVEQGSIARREWWHGRGENEKEELLSATRRLYRCVRWWATASTTAGTRAEAASAAAI